MAANVRVEARVPRDRDSFIDKDRAFRSMMSAFKRRVNEAGVLVEYGRRQSFESRGQKRRRKDKEAYMRRQKEQFELNNKVRDRFGSSAKKISKRKPRFNDSYEEYTDDER